MPRQKRIAKGNIVYHALKRANGRLKIFKKPDDFAAFEVILAEGCERFGMRLCGYCVMGTHSHRWHAAHKTVGTGNARNWNDLAKATFAAMGTEPNIEYIDMPDILRDKYQYFTQATMDKLRAAGYEKETASLEDAVTDYVQNYLLKDTYLGG